jgi:hypothetical protein
MINYLRIVFIETSETQSVKDTIESREAVFERDVHNENVRALWLEESDGGSSLLSRGPVGPSIVEKVDILLSPAESMDLKFGCFGKLNW